MCLVWDIMNKDEQYARGLLRIEKLKREEAAHLGQYALDLMKLRHKHEATCKDCTENSHVSHT